VNVHLKAELIAESARYESADPGRRRTTREAAGLILASSDDFDETPGIIASETADRERDAGSPGRACEVMGLVGLCVAP